MNLNPSMTLMAVAAKAASSTVVLRGIWSLLLMKCDAVVVMLVFYGFAVDVR